MALRAISLFAGVGGLDYGLRSTGAVRTVCYVEGEAYAAAILAARIRDGLLDDAPIWSDVRSFRGEPWSGGVDLVFGGFPCTDASKAGGHGLGIDGARTGLWREFARIIGEVGPRFIFLENVPAIVVRGWGRVVGDVTSLGYDAEWGTFRASDVGAPHERERIFLLGRRRGDVGALPVLRRALVQRPREARSGLSLPSAGGVGVGPVLAREVSNPVRPGLEGIGIPGEPSNSHRWHPEPPVDRVVDGVARWMDELRAIGNGVVPAQAALAWEVLMQRMNEAPDDGGGR